ncbi:hypothetical protein J7L48_08390 [bacterium]|nr:hypothetical protein [bacterium]
MNLNIKLKGLNFKNPLLTASGIFSDDHLDFYQKKLPYGGIVLKTFTYEERLGNIGNRLLEIPCGMMNSIGLANPGIKYLDMSLFDKLKAIKIISIAINDIEEIALFKKVLLKNKIKMVELNLSCPNIKEKKVTNDLRKKKELFCEIRRELKGIIIFAKFSYSQVNKSNIKIIESAGFDGITIMNTIPGIEIDIDKKEFYFNNKVAGISGSFLVPMGLERLFYIKNITDLPIMACGGVKNYKDVLKYIFMGAHLVQIGSAVFNDPMLPVKIERNLSSYLRREKINDINELRGILLK